MHRPYTFDCAVYEARAPLGRATFLMPNLSSSWRLPALGTGLPRSRLDPYKSPLIPLGTPSVLAFLFVVAIGLGRPANPCEGIARASETVTSGQSGAWRNGTRESSGGDCLSFPKPQVARSIRVAGFSL